MELYATQDPESVMFVSIYDTEENSAAVWEKGKQLNKSIMNCTEIPTPTTNFFILKTTWTSDDPDGTKICIEAFDVRDYLLAQMHYTMVMLASMVLHQLVIVYYCGRF